MAYVRARPRYTGPDLGTRLRVVERDGYRCVRCGASVIRAVYSVQHRKSRGAGGTSDPAINLSCNLITLCGSGTTGCHGHVEANPVEAALNGWRVERWDNPLNRPVLVEHESRWVYLDNQARYVDSPPERAA